jgi:hypothetical protein
MVDLVNGNTIVATCTCSDRLQNFSVSRVGESGKFFGFFFCQQLKLTLIDLERELEVTKGMKIRVGYSEGDITKVTYPHPLFFVEEATRNEENNTIEIVAYDGFYKAGNMLYADTPIPGIFILPIYDPLNPYSIIARCSSALGMAGCYSNASNPMLFNEEPNLDGTETVADVLRMCAEATQTVIFATPATAVGSCYARRLNTSSEADLTITKDDYISLKVGDLVALDNICHTTELGNNVRASAGAESGVIQYVRENAFWTAASEEDVATYVDNAWSNVSGISINQFTLDNWFGNYLLEVGDKLSIETDDGSYITTYLLDDVISFDGTLSQSTKWAYEMSAEEDESNPSDLGELLSKTYARVDKANKQITLLASEKDVTNDRVSALEINTNNISATVSEVKTSTEQAIETINDNFETLTETVSTKMTKEDFTIEINKALSNGVDKVETSTGFKFDEEGLTVSKTNSEISTQITEDGMTVSKSGQVVLRANNKGVQAEDLHATTYLKIGNMSRFEDWNGRTGCFWIGG